METLNATFILEKIITKGGLMGRCAQLYKHDPALTDQFIRECIAQCHNSTAVALWGPELVSEIQAYSEKTLIKTS